MSFSNTQEIIPDFKESRLRKRKEKNKAVGQEKVEKSMRRFIRRELDEQEADNEILNFMENL